MALVVSDFFESFPKVSSNHCSSASFATADLCASFQIEKWSTRMRHTHGLVHSSTFINSTMPAVGNCLQRTREVLQVRLGMFALAIRRVGVPHRWRSLVSPRSVIPHVG